MTDAQKIEVLREAHDKLMDVVGRGMDEDFLEEEQENDDYYI